MMMICWGVVIVIRWLMFKYDYPFQCTCFRRYASVKFQSMSCSIQWIVCMNHHLCQDIIALILLSDLLFIPIIILHRFHLVFPLWVREKNGFLFYQFFVLAHCPDHFPQKSFVQPEILLAAMAAASTAQGFLGMNPQFFLKINILANSPNLGFTCPNCTYSMPSDLLSGSPLHFTHSSQHHNQLFNKRNSLSPAFGSSSGASLQPDRKRRFFSKNNMCMNLSLYFISQFFVLQLLAFALHRHRRLMRFRCSVTCRKRGSHILCRMWVKKRWFAALRVAIL